MDRQHPAPRQTPYELVFGPELEATVFGRIAEEAEARGVDPLASDRFHLLASAGDAVRELVPPEAPVDALEQHRALLYHAYNYWRLGKRSYLVDPAVARFLVEAAPTLDDWEPTGPHPAAYIQLPPNLFWGSIALDMKPEPLDGFFLTVCEATEDVDPPARHLAVLAVLGIRRDRAGFSVIPVSTEVGPGIPAPWAEPSGRESGPDFQSVLPGGDIAGLYSVLTAGELFRLVARVAWYIDRHPADLVPVAPPPPGAVDAADAPPARVPTLRVTLGDPSTDR